uniref:CD209 antigen-like protein E n=1 Tax=Cyprinodon variegatus TaxID=28743 RepID=A0A3Q2DR84_CYPVA
MSKNKTNHLRLYHIKHLLQMDLNKPLAEKCHDRLKRLNPHAEHHRKLSKNLYSDLFIDETRLKCEAGWELHGMNCYFFSNYKSTWIEGRDSCRGQGGDLVKIDSREKQNMINDKDWFWIGLTDSEKEGSWVWVDGSPLKERSDCSQNIWFVLKPDGQGGGPDSEVDCWFDGYCKQSLRSICEKIAETQLCFCL